MLLSSLVTNLALAGLASTSPSSISQRQATPAYQAHTIDQPIDHFPKSARYEPHTKATFKQRYWFDSSYYKPGGPVYLYIGGETSGTNRFSNLQTGIIQILMEATNGLGVILENRYYGQSFPFNTSSTDELAYLTTEQTIADNAYFAQHATFPGLNTNLQAPKTPWILYGGSLAGAQTAFSIKQYPNVLYGGIGSSGTIFAKKEYPQWYDPIQKYGPSDCIASINGIVDKMDEIIAQKNTRAIQKLKDIFGLGDLRDIRDFAATIAYPIGGPLNYPTNTWQELNWYPKYSSNDFFEFCGNVTNIDAPKDVRSVDFALSEWTNGAAWTNLGNYANYIKKFVATLCGDTPVDSTSCVGTQNQTYWADTHNSGTRSYLYQTCTEVGAYQVAQPHGPSLISRVLKADYTQQWCNWAFPSGKYNSIPKSPDLSHYNSYGGLDVSADRLALIDGDADVWLDLCYHSNFAPPRYSTDLHPEYLITGGGHHWDSYGIKDVQAEPIYIREAHLWEIRTVKKWLRDFKR